MCPFSNTGEVADVVISQLEEYDSRGLLWFLLLINFSL